MKHAALALLFLPITAYADPLFELHIGDTWRYELVGDAENSVINQISESKTNVGQTWYRLVEYGETYWIRNASEGQVEAVEYFESELPSQPKVNEALIFKYPAQIGDSWGSGDTLISYEGVEKVTVPAGTYDCHMYLFDMGSDYSKSCIAKDVGVVYNEFKIGDEAPRISRLISFTKGT